MTWFWVGCALVVPWMAGTAAILLLRDQRQPKTLSIGAGWLAGQAMMLVLLYAMLILTGAGRARLVVLILGCTAFVLGALLRRRARRRRRLHDRIGEALPANGPTPSAEPLGRLPAICLLCASASLLFKLYILVAAHLTIPVRGDDAISIWLFKAKTIAILDQLPLDETHDYYLGGSIPHYPVFPSLIAAWVPLVAGSWHEHHATLPWLFFGINLVLLIAGGLQRWMTGLAAWLAAYLVASLPLLVIHLYRPGYADLILGSFLAGMVVYLLTWRASGLLKPLLVAAVFAVATACMKREGPPIALIAFICVAAPSWRRIASWPSSLRRAVGAVAVVCILIIFAVVDFTEQAENARELGYHPAVWAALQRHCLDWSSFHFFFWLVAATLPLAACLRGARHRAPALLLTMGLCGFVAAVFLLTPQARFALNDQTPSRLFLQVAPAIVVALAIPLATAFNQGRRPSPTRNQPGTGEKAGREQI